MKIQAEPIFMKRNSFIIIIFLSIAFSGCRKNPVPLSDRQLLFQMDYVNYAWGYQHYGYIIDGEGNILTYDNPEKWNFPDVNYMLPESQVADNLSKCRRSGEKVPLDELTRFAGYIDNISSSKISAPKNTGADAGSTQYICYRYSGTANSYKGSLLKMEGDFTCENLNFYSKKVVSWMKNLGASIHSYQ